MAAQGLASSVEPVIETKELNPAFYTVGYEGRSIQELIDALEQNAISTVIDIRFSPVSRFRPEFSKRNLASLLRSSGIDYVHYRDLGVPRDIRDQAFHLGKREFIWEWYETNVVQRHAVRNLHWFFNCADHPVALLCMEADSRTCHRHRLAGALERVSGLKFVDI